MTNALDSEIGITDILWDGKALFDIKAQVWNPEDNSWRYAIEADFERLGSIQVEIPLAGLDGADEDLVPTHTHTPVLQEKVDATCHSTGMQKHWKCECGKLFKDEACDNEVAEATLVIAKDPENHDGETEIRDAKEATETEAGHTGDTYCKGCGEKIADGEVIPPTGSGGNGDILDDNDNNDSDKNSNDNDKKDSDASAKTGDESNTALWMALLLISLIGGCAAVIRRKEC